MDSVNNNDPNPPSYVSRIGLGDLMRQLREIRRANSGKVLAGRKFNPMAETDPPGMNSNNGSRI